jgi:hypothetical protein
MLTVAFSYCYAECRGAFARASMKDQENRLMTSAPDRHQSVSVGETETSIGDLHSGNPQVVAG